MDDLRTFEGLDPAERDAVRRLRAALVRPIPAGVAAAHLTAMRGAGRRARRWPGVLAVAATLAIAGGAAALPDKGGLPEVAAEAARLKAPPQAGAPLVTPVGTGVTTQDEVLTPADAFEHGHTVSDLARTTTVTGKVKGKQVSEVASSKSADRRKDGDHRPATNPVGLAPGSGDGGTPDGAPAGGSGKPDGTPGKGPGGP